MKSCNIYGKFICNMVILSIYEYVCFVFRCFCIFAKPILKYWKFAFFFILFSCYDFKISVLFCPDYVTIFIFLEKGVSVDYNILEMCFFALKIIVKMLCHVVIFL